VHPLLLVSLDSYQTAKQIDALEALPTKDDKEKIALIEKMISEHVDIKNFSWRIIRRITKNQQTTGL